MRIAVFGAGAVGGYFGGRLAQAGHDILFIARGEHLQAIRNHGFRVDSIGGDFVCDPVEATDDPSGVGVVDVVLVGVRTWQLEEAAQAMKPLIGATTLVVPLLNGVEAHLRLAEALGAEHVLIGLSKIICKLLGPGHIHHVGMEPYVAFGEFDGPPREQTVRLLQVFQEAGVRSEIPTDITVALWSKFLFVVSWGGVGAVTRSSIGVLRELSETRDLLEQSIDEIFSLSQACEIRLPEPIRKQTMTAIDALPFEGTTSLQRDIEEGRRSELDSWNGAVVRLASKVGIPVPLHDFIYRSLLPLELKARGGV